MPSQQPRKTKRLRESVTRADLLILARAVDQLLAELRADVEKLTRLMVDPPPRECACNVIHSGACPTDKVGFVEGAGYEGRREFRLTVPSPEEQPPTPASPAATASYRSLTVPTDSEGAE